MSDPAPIVTLDQVHQGFDGTPVLRGISLSVEAGEVVAVIGPSGSGKSTLLRVICGLVPANSGRVLVDGIAIHEATADLHRLHQKVGMVFQSYNLFPHMTALRNITLGLTEVLRLPSDEANAVARKLLAKVRLSDKDDAYPDELSGGQQQRIAIARSLAMNPKVILLDEVTAALDPETVKEVLVTIRELADDGMTLIIVTHEMGFAREVASRVVFMDDGLVVEEGPPSHLLGQPRHARTRSFLDKVL
ncbi:MAG: amino acid ABC transporter ATP-binding protein [Rhodospirillaceae bacterium]|nr:amino acid ABC transporter ATP-binding protein [Rhodospirillaceae bacterium]